MFDELEVVAQQQLQGGGAGALQIVVRNAQIRIGTLLQQQAGDTQVSEKE